MFTKLFFSMFLFLTSVSLSQKDTIYTLSADIGIGYSGYITTLEYQNLKKHGITSTLRIMWHPEHLLSLGIESGYTNLYSVKSNINSVEFGYSELTASMVCVPSLIVASMRIFPITLPGFEIHGGGGIYWLFNYGELYGRNISSSILSFGNHVGATYMIPLTQVFSLGVELKYHYISKLQDSDIGFKILFSYDFLSW